MHRARRLAHLGHWEWDISNNSMHWCEEVFHIAGRNSATSTPTIESFEAAIYPEDLSTFQKKREYAIAKNDGMTIEHRIVWPNGTIRRFCEIAEFIRDDSGNTVRVEGTVQDITEKKTLELALQALRKDFESCVAERTRELNIISSVASEVF